MTAGTGDIITYNPLDQYYSAAKTLYDIHYNAHIYGPEIVEEADIEFAERIK